MNLNKYKVIILLVILLAVSEKNVANNYSHYGVYKNCIGDESGLKFTNEIKSKANYNENGYNLNMITYKTSDNKYSCAIVDEKRHVVINELPTMTPFCEGEWDQDKAIWIDMHNPHHSELIDARAPSEVLRDILEGNETENNIDEVLGDFKCRYTPYSLKDVEEINNTAFYFFKLKKYQVAINILKQVVELDPNRAVAYYNLGDAYLAINQKDFAIKNYNKYIKLMKIKKIERKIPKRVLEIVGGN